MTDIAVIIKDLVDKIDNRIFYDYVVDPPPYSLTHFYTCNTKWIKVGETITNNGGGYADVTGFDPDKEIFFTGGMGPWIQDPPNNYYLIRSPFFISGTRLATNTEWTMADTDITKKTPIIWLLETMEQTTFGKGDTREFESSLRIFFLDETNIKDFYTEDHRREVVFPMQKLVLEFIDTINKDRRYKTIDNYRIKTFSRFGVEKENGMFQNILDANLSGVELTLTLTKFKENCKC